ncbi:MAG: alpha/beta hydrolase [Propionibacterium sp.]|nr:alpha/beta hydrolase [Propionibacterium sp.]
MRSFSRRVSALVIAPLVLLSGCIAGTPEPTSSPEPSAPASPTPPPTPEADVVDEEVSVGAHELPGTLTQPSGEAEPVAVVLLWGSGPHDRDSTIGTAGNAILRDLAHGLADHGISSLRFDKRTFAAQGSYDPATFTVDDEYLDDAASALDLLASHPDLDGHLLFVVGHSQGGMVLPEVLARNPEAAGGISLAGSPRSLFDIIVDQQADALAASGITEEQQAAQLDLVREAMDEAKALDDPEGEVPVTLRQSMGAPYVVSLNRLDPVGTAQALEVPLLFLHGEADQQVYLEADFRAWEAALEGEDDVEFRSYPGLTHFFRESQGGSALDDMNEPATVDEQMIEDMANWLLAPRG